MLEVLFERASRMSPGEVIVGRLRQADQDAYQRGDRGTPARDCKVM